MYIAIIAILILSLVIFYFYHKKSLEEFQEYFGKIEQLEHDCDKLQQTKIQLNEANQELGQQKQNLTVANERLLDTINNNKQNLQMLDSVIEEKQKIIDQGLASLEEEKRKLIDQRIADAQTAADRTINDAKTVAELEAKKWADLAEDEKSKYAAIVEALKAVEETEESHVIQLSDNDKQDIQYLLEIVMPRINHKDIVSKLIWQEYIQTPLNEVLNVILPNKDCAGIYKITNIETKKSYIGRSTNVKKRLQDHVKSACGISTIADQKIHRAMKDEGLWKFKFELLEECDKTKLSEREKYYISFFKTEEYGWNQKAGG